MKIRDKIFYNGMISLWENWLAFLRNQFSFQEFSPSPLKQKGIVWTIAWSYQELLKCFLVIKIVTLYCFGSFRAIQKFLNCPALLESIRNWVKNLYLICLMQGPLMLIQGWCAGQNMRATSFFVPESFIAWSYWLVQNHPVLDFGKRLFLGSF